MGPKSYSKRCRFSIEFKQPKNCSTLTTWLISLAICLPLSCHCTAVVAQILKRWLFYSHSIHKHNASGWNEKSNGRNVVKNPLFTCVPVFSVLRSSCSFSISSSAHKTTKHQNRVELQLHCSEDVKMGEKLQHECVYARVRVFETKLLKCHPLNRALRCVNRRRQFAINIPRCCGIWFVYKLAIDVRT